jgi:SAM-dependent methyltransferase
MGPALLALFAIALCIGAFVGAPYVPILKRDSQALLDLAELKPGQTLIDIGCGDGRLLRAAAARGIKGIGYEVSPILVLVSRIVTWRYRHLITIHLADIWHTKLAPADAIYVFFLDRYMKRLDAKFRAEITKPTKVICYVFLVPDRKPIRANQNTAVFLYGDDAKA